MEKMNNNQIRAMMEKAACFGRYRCGRLCSIDDMTYRLSADGSIESRKRRDSGDWNKAVPVVSVIRALSGDAVANDCANSVHPWKTYMAKYGAPEISKYPFI